MHAETTDRPYVLISTDGHAGAAMLDYRPYLESTWHNEFDAWAATIDTDAWDLLEEEGPFKTGASSFMATVNWDSDERTAALEAEGISAEVLFPNTIQPFYPTGALTAPGPRTQGEFERRWAGVRAHNRWLVDFCAATPGRRFGLAQLFLDDVDAAVAEVRWAKEAGLAGVLLPPDHHLKLNNLYYRSLDPVWAVCAELGMSVHRHGIVVSSDEDGPASRDGAHIVGVYESMYFGQRALFQLILSGVLDRHQNLQCVFTEVGEGWLLPLTRQLDGLVKASGVPGTVRNLLCGNATAQLSMLPSEYVARQVSASSLLHREDLHNRAEIGVDRLLWGSDFPHHEGTAGYTHEWLRAAMSDLPEAEVRALTSENAARVYNADLAFLQTIADRVGPTVAEVAAPLTITDFPQDPNFAMSFPSVAQRINA